MKTLLFALFQATPFPLIFDDDRVNFVLFYAAIGGVIGLLWWAVS